MGIRLALAGAFDVIILGADLPDMSGLEAMNQLWRAQVTVAVVFASITPATTAGLHLSDCS